MQLLNSFKVILNDGSLRGLTCRADFLTYVENQEKGWVSTDIPLLYSSWPHRNLHDRPQQACPNCFQPRIQFRTSVPVQSLRPTSRAELSTLYSLPSSCPRSGPLDRHRVLLPPHPHLLRPFTTLDASSQLRTLGHAQPDGEGNKVWRRRRRHSRPLTPRPRH
jgi:hypothetical protein